MVWGRRLDSSANPIRHLLLDRVDLRIQIQRNKLTEVGSNSFCCTRNLFDRCIVAKTVRQPYNFRITFRVTIILIEAICATFGITRERRHVKWEQILFIVRTLLSASVREESWLCAVLGVRYSTPPRRSTKPRHASSPGVFSSRAPRSR
ncbi:MAG: hypothetical protein ACI8T1_003555, partial [Verrucomicrobiales bacterium]